MAPLPPLRLLSALSAVTAASAAFVHPGVLFSADQISFVKASIASGKQPVTDALSKLLNSRFVTTYTPVGPPANGWIDCGSYSHPDFGCTNESEDGEAAVDLAYLYAVTGNVTYGQRAISIMNMYSKGLRGYNNSNAPLQSGWGASKWARAAEIVLHAIPGSNLWPAQDVTAFQTMLKTITLPLIYNGSTYNGNWELTMIEAMIGIAVFSEDQDLFDHAVTFWKQRVPAYFYITADGSAPKPAPRGVPSWYGQAVFNASTNGVAQETCRDFGHMSYGLAASINVAETARIQDLDLYNDSETKALDRLTSTLEFHAKLLRGAPVPSYLCGGAGVKLFQAPTFQIGFSHYSGRLGLPLPSTLSHLQADIWTMADPQSMFMDIYETFTHGDVQPQQ